jgi:hypothetical protein
MSIMAVTGFNWRNRHCTKHAVFPVREKIKAADKYRRPKYRSLKQE